MSDKNNISDCIPRNEDDLLDAIHAAEYIYCHTGDRRILEAILDSHRQGDIFHFQGKQKFQDLRSEEAPIVIEEPIEEGIFHHHDRLLVLKKLIDVVEGATCAVVPEDIESLLLDLGLLLQEFSQEYHRNYTDVHEDPQNRGDALGNVKMINKKVPLAPDQLNLLGSGILNLVHKFRDQRRVMAKGYSIAQELTVDFGDYDDVESETILAAKKKIRFLRKENSRLDRRNETLYLRLLEYKTKVGEPNPFLARNYPLRTSPLLKRNEQSTDKICTNIGDDVTLNHDLENLGKQKHVSNSQVDFTW